MISAEQVRELRAKTGAGIMECKKALKEVDGNIDKAVDVLRKSGLAKATKKSARSTKEGLIDVALSRDGSRAAILEVNCETDFVARTEDFKQFVQSLAGQVVESQPADVDDLLASPRLDDGSQSVAEALQALIGKIGENMSLARFQVAAKGADDERLGTYVHAGNQIGVVVRIKGKLDESAVRDIAMHVAAMHPHYVAPDDVPAEVAEKEKQVLGAAGDLSGKPPEVVEKMVSGRYRKFLNQVCLTEQVFIKDPEGKQTIAALLKSLDPASRVVEFVRFQVGESSE